MASQRKGSRFLRIGHSPVLRHVLAGCLAFSVVFGWAPPAHAESFLSIRQTVLTRQRDRVLIGFEARIGPIGQAHSIQDDCDLHVPLITTALFLSILGEIKNACSMGPTRNELIALGSGPIQVKGAFRIWFEGHDGGIPFREEQREIPEAYENSGPAHLVELHPLTRVGALDLTGRVRLIEKNGQAIVWKTAKSLQRAVQTQITIRRRTVANRRYIVIRCTCPRLANHYKLAVEIRYAPHWTDNDDGVVTTARILNDQGELLLARARLFALKGTPAALVLGGVEPGDKLTIYGLARLSLRPLLGRVTSSERTISLPIELVVLHAE